MRAKIEELTSAPASNDGEIAALNKRIEKLASLLRAADTRMQEVKKQSAAKQQEVELLLPRLKEAEEAVLERQRKLEEASVELEQKV